MELISKYKVIDNIKSIICRGGDAQDILKMVNQMSSVLPKGHGNLIDADKIVSYTSIEYDFDGNWREINDFNEIPIMIKADKAGS